MGRMTSVVKDALKKRDVNPEMVGKVDFEKNDLLALIIAVASIAIPVLIVMFAGIALIIFVLFYLGR